MANKENVCQRKYIWILCDISWTVADYCLGIENIEWNEVRSDVASLHQLNGLHNHMHRPQKHRARRHVNAVNSETDGRPMSLFEDFWQCENGTAYIIQHEQVWKRIYSLSWVFSRPFESRVFRFGKYQIHYLRFGGTESSNIYPDMIRLEAPNYLLLICLLSSENSTQYPLPLTLL